MQYICLPYICLWSNGVHEHSQYYSIIDIYYLNGAAHEGAPIAGFHHDGEHIRRHALTKVKHFTYSTSKVLHSFTGWTSLKSLIRAIKPLVKKYIKTDLTVIIIRFFVWDIYTGVYLTTSGKILKTAGHIDFQTVYIHIDTLENSGQNDCDFRRLPAFK